MAGLAVEGGYLLLPALAVLGWSEAHGQGGFLAHGGAGYGVAFDVMLVASGALTALPLIGFAYAVRRVPLSAIGLLQYISPTLQFLIGVLAFHEPFDRDRAIGFAFIWLALAMFASHGVWRARRTALASA
jgi:chloramphenicol-sensitive protein RarD